MTQQMRILKEKLEVIKYGILKMASSRILPSSSSFIIKVYEIGADGYLYGSISTSSSAKSSIRSNFPVKLKFVRKDENLFIKVAGHASLVRSESKQSQDSEAFEQCLQLKIKIQDAQYYKKRALSLYTSVLQAINNHSLQQAPEVVT